MIYLLLSVIFILFLAILFFIKITIELNKNITKLSNDYSNVQGIINSTNENYCKIITKLNTLSYNFDYVRKVSNENNEKIKTLITVVKTYDKNSVEDFVKVKKKIDANYQYFSRVLNDIKDTLVEN